MNKVAIVFNTNKLGGAERSMLLQLSTLNRNDLCFYLPKSQPGGVEKEIERLNLGFVTYYNYPKALYLLSRSNFFFSVFSLLEIFLFLLLDKSLSSLENYDVVYLNGNKAAFLFFFKHILKTWKGRIVWHLRDYFYQSFLTNLVWSVLLYGKKVEIVCNSFSVKNDLNASVFSKQRKTVIYNPSGLKLKARKLQSLENIGFVSMMAPWKGVHEMIFFAWLYECELKALGIKKISIYGDNLYETQGEHRNYKEDLKKMLNKFPSTLISFEGMQAPEKIFSEIDCLIHHSLEREPFGRVIIEGMDAHIPVVTTGIGGAGEIVASGVDGLIIPPYHRAELFKNIKKLATDQILREQIILNGDVKAHSIQMDISKQIAGIINEAIS